MVTVGIEVGGNQAAITKGSVEAAVAVVAGQGKVVAAIPVRVSHRHDLAVVSPAKVRIDCHARGVVPAAVLKIGGDLAVGAEARVEAAVATIACQGKVNAGGAAPRGRTSSHHDLPVGLDSDHVAAVVVTARVFKVRRHQPPVAEGRVEVTGRQQRRSSSGSRARRRGRGEADRATPRFDSEFRNVRQTKFRTVDLFMGVPLASCDGPRDTSKNAVSPRRADRAPRTSGSGSVSGAWSYWLTGRLACGWNH